MKIKVLIIIFLLGLIVLAPTTYVARADELTESIKEQLNNLDLSGLDEYYSGIDSSHNNVYVLISEIINGKFNEDGESFLEYITKSIFTYTKKNIPIIISIIAIIILSSILNNLRSSFGGEGVSNIINLICFLTVIILLSVEMINCFNNTKNAIKNIVNLIEIMSPIMLTLMIAVGGKVSASIYSPTVAFLSTGIINVILSVVMPLIIISAVFSLLSNFTQTIKLNKFSDCANSVIKWIIGIFITIFTIFLSIQGMTSAAIDGVSIKAAKYAISNSIPIVGGFLRDGFDVVVAGSVLIKNSIGIASVIALLYTIASPVMSMLSLSILLKICSAIGELFSAEKISGICMTISKTLSYLIAVTLIVGLMLFILVLLIILSANAFV